ncbi:MAG: hypothetical protein ACSHXI_13985 [Hoeflea sp.]|uniref:hypothetical protein n=1 Tax=Hoeflea sp. TaxID=1940281 RepID=UPI003EFA184F
MNLIDAGYDRLGVLNELWKLSFSYLLVFLPEQFEGYEDPEKPVAAFAHSRITAD